MGMCHAYGAVANKSEMSKLLGPAVDLGYTFFDTAEIYGTPDNAHDNEEFSRKCIKTVSESAKADRLKPYVYFQNLLSRMPNIDFKNDPEKLESLLPWSDDLPEDCWLPADSA